MKLAKIIFYLFLSTLTQSLNLDESFLIDESICKLIYFYIDNYFHKFVNQKF